MDHTRRNASTPEDKAILEVISSREGGAPNYARHHRVVTENCEKCGKNTMLVYYEVA